MNFVDDNTLPKHQECGYEKKSLYQAQVTSISIESSLYPSTLSIEPNVNMFSQHRLLNLGQGQKGKQRTLIINHCTHKLNKMIMKITIRMNVKDVLYSKLGPHLLGLPVTL